MYSVIVVLLLLILPALSIIVEAGFSQGVSIMGLVGKWYVFWASGMRLLLAGIRQVSQPRLRLRRSSISTTSRPFELCGKLGSRTWQWARLRSARSSGRRGLFRLRL